MKTSLPLGPVAVVLIRISASLEMQQYICTLRFSVFLQCICSCLISSKTFFKLSILPIAKPISLNRREHDSCCPCFRSWCCCCCWNCCYGCCYCDAALLLPRPRLGVGSNLLARRRPIFPESCCATSRRML